MQHEKLEQFIAFCAEKNPDEEYEYHNMLVCALGQFNGYTSHGWEHEFGKCDSMAADEPHTFGALTERLKEHFDL